MRFPFNTNINYKTLRRNIIKTNLISNASEEYFVDLCIEHFADSLLWIVSTDSYIRQPCYSLRTRAQYYLIFNNISQATHQKLKYIQGEFPEFLLNYLSENEIENYPEHGKWQFYFSPILYNKENKSIVINNKETNMLAIEQALFGIGHIARLYYLRNLDSKNLTWAVRQIGWALKYAELGIVKLYNYITCLKYEVFFPDKIKEEIKWLIEVNKNWVNYEKALLADLSKYQDASLKLNNIVEYFSALLMADKTTSPYYINDSNNEYDDTHFEFISSFKRNLENEFKESLVAFYLHGSAARGDTHASSDVDSIAIFKKLDEATITRLKSLIDKYDNISVNPLSINGLINYPSFRFYGLSLGSKKMSGSISFQNINTNNSIIQGMLNNLFTILQISRAWLLLDSYGPRSPHILKLMMKLSDHGYLRLKILLTTGKFPNKKEEVKEFFKDDSIAVQIMEYLLDIPSFDKNIIASTQDSNYEPIKANYLLLIQFVVSQLKIFIAEKRL